MIERRHTVDSQTKTFSIPDICPKCGRTVSPRIVFMKSNVGLFETNVSGYSGALTCNGCNTLLTASFSSTPNASGCYTLEECHPTVPTERLFDDIVSLEISSDFVEIYNQAKAAEEYGLDHIAGMGYRKSLEFLVKDFAIKQDPSNEENIRAKSLDTVLKKYIDDKYVKMSAKAASWVGNDETHYQRKHEDKDIADLKRYLDSCLLFIMAIMNTAEASEFTDPTSDTE